MSKTYEEFYREDWMTNVQWECASFIADLFGGFNHVFGKWHAVQNGVYLNSTNGCNRFATFDFDKLTRAVVLAHDRCIRFAIEPSGPGMLQLWATKRKGREGRMSERHPTLEQAIELIRR